VVPIKWRFELLFSSSSNSNGSSSSIAFPRFRFPKINFETKSLNYLFVVGIRLSSAKFENAFHHHPLFHPLAFHIKHFTFPLFLQIHSKMHEIKISRTSHNKCPLENVRKFLETFFREWISMHITVKGCRHELS